MKVKIGENIYDSNDEPIMVILGDDDKYNIENMDKECTKYLAYPEGMHTGEAVAFMND